MPRSLESYSAEVLAEFIRRRGISFFPEELDGIERRRALIDLAARMNSLGIERRRALIDLAARMNSLSPEAIAQAMERLPTDVLEWGVLFEALSCSEDDGE